MPIGANWNQSSHIKKGILILKWNTYQNGTLILSKWNSLNRNTRIKMEHLSKWNPHIKSIVGNLRQSRNPPSVAVTCLACCLACRLGRASQNPSIRCCRLSLSSQGDEVLDMLDMICPKAGGSAAFRTGSSSGHLISVSTAKDMSQTCRKFLWSLGDEH